MHAYITRRILEAIPLILLVLVMNFIILHIAPGDPVFLFIQGGGGATEEYVQQVRGAWVTIRECQEESSGHSAPEHAG